MKDLLWKHKKCIMMHLLLLHCTPSWQKFIFSFFIFHFSTKTHVIKLNWGKWIIRFDHSNLILNLIITKILFVFVILGKSCELWKWCQWQQISSHGNGVKGATCGNGIEGATHDGWWERYLWQRQRGCYPWSWRGISWKTRKRCARRVIWWWSSWEEGWGFLFCCLLWNRLCQSIFIKIFLVNYVLCTELNQILCFKFFITI